VRLCHWEDLEAEADEMGSVLFLLLKLFFFGLIVNQTTWKVNTMGARSQLTPQMLSYQEKFADSGDILWLPYLMYFHPSKYRSSVVNTDVSGFRYSEHTGKRYSVCDCNREESVRLLAGSSTVFGIGASSDRWTLSSCLSENDLRPEPWLNFGGRSFNSMQELMLLVLYRHLLPPIKEIVLFSGFNNLGLARLPSSDRMEHGAFFNCNQFFEALNPVKVDGVKSVAKWLLGSDEVSAEPPPSLEEQMRYAADLTLRHLYIWQTIAKDLSAKLTYVLQPLSGWVRPNGCSQEEALFAELDQLGGFTEIYGDILSEKICFQYAELLRIGVESIGAHFVNISPILSASLDPEQWLFVDRIHFTDDGYNFVSKKLLEVLL
jgi:lysophospholipase L1-like esterase